MRSQGDFTVSKVSCGVDWISCTLAKDTLDSQVWYGDALFALQELSKQGYEIKSRKMLGFEGWAVDNCFVGANDTTFYAQFSGEKAEYAYPYLEHPKAHYSRIDLQVTVHYEQEHLKEGRYQYARAKHHNATLPKYRQRTVDIWIGNGGGDTVYIGAVSSDQRGRIYNKAKQSDLEQYERAWRYEVVLRNDYAVYMARTLYTKGASYAAFVVSQVSNWYRERGVEIRGLGSFDATPIATPRNVPTDVERKMRWIEKQVVPTVRKLAQLGYSEQVMDLLAKALIGSNQT